MRNVTPDDADAFSFAASAYLASLEHVEAKLPNGIGTFTPESIPSHNVAAKRVVGLLERFVTEYDLRAVVFRGYMFLLVPYGDRLLHYVIPTSQIGEVSDGDGFDEEE